MGAWGSPTPPIQARIADVSVFLDTDLGTRLALTVAPDSSIRHLKSQVAMEHAAAFPDLGPVAVKSFQVLRKGAMYHLSDLMTVRSAFARVKAGCFLHVKMTAVEADKHCCRDEDRGRSSEACLTFDVDTHVRELPATTSEIARVVLPQRLEVPNDVNLSSTLHQNAEQKKNEAVILASDVQTISVSAIDILKRFKRRGRHGDKTGGAYVSSTFVANVNISTDQSNLSLVGEEVDARKEDPHHSFRDNDLGVVLGNKQVEMKEGTLGEVYSLDDFSQEKEGKKIDHVNILSADPGGESNDPDTTVVNKLDRIPLKTNTNSHGVLSSTSFQLEVHGNSQEDSIQLENPIIPRKNRKRKNRQLVTPKSVVAQEMTKPLTGTVVAQKTISEGDGAYNIEMTSREKTIVQSSDVLLSLSQLDSGRQGTKNVQLMSDAQATSDLSPGQGGNDLVHEWYRNPTVEDASNFAPTVVASEETSTNGINDGYQGGKKGSKSNNFLEKVHTAGNSSQEKNCGETNKFSYVGITSLDTTEEKNHGGYGEKEANSDIFSSHGEIVQQGNCYVIEKPIGVGKRKKRRHSQSSDDNTIQNATKSPGFARNASSTQNTSAQPLNAKQTALVTIGEETAEEKDNCGHGEKEAKPVIVSTPEIVKNSSAVQQGNSDAIEYLNGDRKRRKKGGRHLESSKHDPIQDVTKSSGYITNEKSIQNTSADPQNTKKQTTPDTIRETTVSDCKKFDENMCATTTNVINEVLADLNCTDSLSKGLNEDPLKEQTYARSSPNEVGILEYTGVESGTNASVPPKYSAEILSDAPISLSNHKKSNGKLLKVWSTVPDLSHSFGGVPEESANTELREFDSLRCSDSDLKDVLTENTMPADDNIKSTKRHRKKTSLKHVSTDSGKAIQSLVEKVNQVDPEDLQGENATRADIVEGGSTIDSLASIVPKIQKKSKRSCKTGAPKTHEIDHSQLNKDIHDEHVPDVDVNHCNDNAVETPIKSLVNLKDDTIFTYDSSNTRKGRKKSCKTKLRRQHTDLKHDSDADLMNFRAQQRTVIPDSSDVEPNGYVAGHPCNEKINFIDHFSRSGTNGPFDCAEDNKDETTQEVKGKRKIKNKTMQSQRSGSIEPNDLLESHLNTDNTSLTDLFGPGNVCVSSDLAENTIREVSNLKKAKEKKKGKRKSDLVKSESQNPNGAHQGVENCTDNGKGDNAGVTQSSSMLQQKIEDAICDSTPEKKLHQVMFDADIQNNLAIDKDHTHISKQRNSTSQTKHHVKSRNHNGSISGRTCPNPNAVSNPVKSFSMSPPASSENAEGIFQNANRYRVAVRKVPRKGHGQVSDKSKKGSSKRGTSAIFSDDISEGSDDVLNTISKKAAIEASSDDSYTSPHSGVSSTALYESDVPDDDGTVSLSQRSLREGLHIASILRGSSSYKKARLKQTEQLDDTEIPDSLPPDSLQD